MSGATTGRRAARRRLPRIAGAAALALACCASLLLPREARAQQDTLRNELRSSQLRLEQIRRERQQLEQELARLKTQVRNASRELANIERQRETSETILKELDLQSTALASSVDVTAQELMAIRDRLQRRRDALHARLRALYKEGPLHDARVLLGARSFGELLNRYKYVHLISVRDRMLIEDVSQLERHMLAQDEQLKQSMQQLERLREDKQREHARLTTLERDRERALRGFRQREQKTAGRLQQLERDQARLANAITELERRRKEAERRRVVAGGQPRESGTLSTRSLGSLRWPVEGDVIYRFGPERRANGVTLRWNGIGIAAPVGTGVRAVEAGTVVMAAPFEGYGPTVMISHGGGYYTLYLYLSALRVREGQAVTAGQVVGTVGGERTPEGAHIEFQVRVPGRGGVPEPVDPLGWLRRQAGA